MSDLWSQTERLRQKRLNWIKWCIVFSIIGIVLGILNIFSYSDTTTVCLILSISANLMCFARVLDISRFMAICQSVSKLIDEIKKCGEEDE